jgi:hypothetical protein
MSDLNLSVQDLELLLETCDLWKNKDADAAVMQGIMMSMLARTEDEVERRLAETTSKLEKMRSTDVVRGERVILLKAKLIQMKQAAAAEQAFAANG